MTLLETPRAEEYFVLLRKRLDDETYQHSISSAQFMLAIADEIGATPEKATVTGLLHDLGKGFDDGQLLEAARAYGLTPNEVQRVNPKLLHGPVGAEEARRRLGVVDDEVCEAIYWHTTGRPGFCRLGLGLYLADFAEPLRTHPEAAVAREILEEQGFEEAVLFAAREKLRHILMQPSVDPASKSFYKWLQTELG